MTLSNMTIRFETKSEARTRVKLRLLKRQIMELKKVVHTAREELEVTTSILMQECYNLNMQLHALRDMIAPSLAVHRNTKRIRSKKRTTATITIRSVSRIHAE